MLDKLGDRMKAYETCYTIKVPRRTNVIVRLDGKAFHTLTKGMERPFDATFMAIMAKTAKELANTVQGVKLAYVQSDEISLLLTDYENVGTCAYFDNNIQKIASVTASIATAYFNKCMAEAGIKKMGFFDSRVFSIPDRWEVRNYFLWRQKDARRNAILAVAQKEIGKNKINGKSTSQLLKDLLSLESGPIDVDKAYPMQCQLGTLFVKALVTKDTDRGPIFRTSWEPVTLDLSKPENEGTIASLFPLRDETFEGDSVEPCSCGCTFTIPEEKEEKEQTLELKL